MLAVLALLDVLAVQAVLAWFLLAVLAVQAVLSGLCHAGTETKTKQTQNKDATRSHNRISIKRH